MSEEHGYQRTGKKCREKFENLYKYYKKTKEGKAGRQDGKHYRFFRQLEALYGETSNHISSSVSEAHHVGSHFPYNPTPINQDSHNFHSKLSDNSLSLSNNSSSDFNTSSSDDSDLNDKEKGKKRRGKRGLKAKIKDFIDGQMKKLMEKQEVWLDKMMNMIEHKEQERILREEEWRKQETARMEREQKFWANERAWIESRDATLMDALHKLGGGGKELKKINTSSNEAEFRNGGEAMTSSVNKDGEEHWPESEITRLIQLRTSMESRFQQMGICDEVLWEEIAGKMACLGYDKSGTMCKNKWGSINSYLMKCNKKRKENCATTPCYNFQINNEQGRSYSETRHNIVSNDHQNAGNPTITDGCFRYLMGDQGENNLWDNYELKLSKGGNN